MTDRFVNESQVLERNLIARVNVGDILRRCALRDPDKIAVVDGERRISFREFNERANQIARKLLAEGLTRGDRVALMMRNSFEFLAVYFAVAKVGLVLVPINYGLQPKEIAFILQDAGVRMMITESALETLVKALQTELAKQDPALSWVSVGRINGPVPVTEWDHWLRGVSTEEVEVYVENEDPVQCLYTSGTTSKPKGVMTSHLAVYVTALGAALNIQTGKNDVSLCMMPLFHCAQLNGMTLPAIAVGSRIVVVKGFDPAVIPEILEKEGVTHMFALPMMYRAMLAMPGVADRNYSLKYCIFAMAPMPEDTLRRGKEVFRADFMLGFGQTEMTPPTTILYPEDVHQGGAVGRPGVNIDVAVMDDQGMILPRGQVGEIVYRGPAVMLGYLHNPEQTGEVFRHGWFHSGDIGYFDDDGLLWFLDRKKDMVKTGGENVSSLEVEQVLLRDPRIQDCAVIGLPHPKWEEAVTALVIKQKGVELTEEDVIAFCKQELAGYKVPKAVVFVDDFPRTSTGKIQKHILRNQYRPLYLVQ